MRYEFKTTRREMAVRAWNAIIYLKYHLHEIRQYQLFCLEIGIQFILIRQKKHCKKATAS